MDVDRVQRKPFQFKLRSVLILTAIAAALFGLIASVRNHFPKDLRGPMEDRSEWPRQLQELIADAAETEIDVTPVRVYCVEKAWSDLYYWQMRGSPELLALMAKRWPLQPATKDEIARFWSQLPAGWGIASATVIGQIKCGQWRAELAAGV